MKGDGDMIIFKKYQWGNSTWDYLLEELGVDQAENVEEVGVVIAHIKRRTEREEILSEIFRQYGNDFLGNYSESEINFYVKHWKEARDLTILECYAYLNTIFGYDIGWEYARKIIDYLPGKFDIHLTSLGIDEFSRALMIVTKWDLGLNNLSFDSFGKYDCSETIYDWN